MAQTFSVHSHLKGVRSTLQKSIFFPFYREDPLFGVIPNLTVWDLESEYSKGNYIDKTISLFYSEGYYRLSNQRPTEFPLGLNTRGAAIG